MRLLKLLRSLLKLGRAELSRESGVSIRELARIEDDGHIPRPPVIGRIDRAITRVMDQRQGIKPAPVAPRAGE